MTRITMRTSLQRLSVGLTLIGCLWASAALAATELKLGHFGSDNHASQIAAVQFAENVAKRTNGEVTVAVIPKQDGPTLLKNVMNGSVDMSLSGQEHLEQYVPFFQAVSAPFSIQNYEHADRLLDGPFKKWATPAVEKIGLVYLSSWEWGFRQITNSKRPINTPDDVKGLKLRTPPNLTYQLSMKSLGADVQSVPFTKLVEAMRTGTLDGQENPFGVIYALKLYESQKYITTVNYLYNSMTHVVAKPAWDKLTKEQQKIIQEESDNSSLLMRKLVRDEEAKQIKAMKTMGIQIDTPKLAPFKAKMGPVYDMIKKNIGEADFNYWMQMSTQLQ